VTSIRSSTRASALFSCAIFAFAAPAAAQTDAARAESLFRQGKQLLEDKKYDQACPMFAESARLDPSSGVELALGICYEGQGRTASAWGAFSVAEALARRDGRPDRAAAAAERVKALEGQLSRVTFDVSPDATVLPGLELFEDSTLLASVSWAGGPVDPGNHTVEVRAPGRMTFTRTFTVNPGGDRVHVAIPPLALAPAALLAPSPVVAPPPPLGPPPTSPWKVVGYAGLGTGAVAIVVASVVGGVVLGKASTVHDDCPSNPCSDKAAVSENATAGTLADASTGLFIAGGVVGAAGFALLLFAPRHASPSSSPTGGLVLTPELAPGYLGLQGGF
jgi:hypothetical protein